MLKSFRRSVRLHTFAVSAALLSTVVVAACANSSSAGLSTAGAAINWEWELPTSFDPVVSSAGWDVHVLSLVYTAITSLDKDGNATPGAAQSWKYAPDGKSIDFTLRPNLSFTDGTKLDAAAVKTNILRGRDAKDSRIASQLREVTDVQVHGDRDFTVVLDRVDYQIPNLLAGKTGMIVSPKAIQDNAAALSTHPVGSGPYQLTEYVPDSHANLVQNSGYYDAAHITVPNFSVQAITNPQQILAALQTGQVNVALIPGHLAKAAEAAGFKVNQIPAQTVNCLNVKTTEAPYNDPRVVQALNYAIDRQALVQTQEGGYGTPSYQPFPKEFPVGYDAGLADLYPHDPAKAKQLLAEAGHPDGLPITLTTVSAEGTAEQLQSQLDEGGFKVTLDVIPNDQSSNITYIQKARALVLDGTAGRESPLQMLEVLYDTDGLMNPTRTEDPAIKAALDQIRSVPLDSPAYAPTLRAAVKLVSTSPSAPHVWLYAYPRLLATSPKLTGLPSTLIVQRFEGVEVAS